MLCLYVVPRYCIVSFEKKLKPGYVQKSPTLADFFSFSFVLDKVTQFLDLCQFSLRYQKIIAWIHEFLLYSYTGSLGTGLSFISYYYQRTRVLLILYVLQCLLLSCKRIYSSPYFCLSWIFLSLASIEFRKWVYSPPSLLDLRISFFLKVSFSVLDQQKEQEGYSIYIQSG